MNRITRKDPRHEPVVTSFRAAWSVESAVSSRVEEACPLGIFAPLHYEPSYCYPLLVWLHGDGDHEGQLRRVMPLISMRNYVAVAPRGDCPMPSGKRGFRWSSASVPIDAAEWRIEASIEQAARNYRINPERVFLVGFGSGGTMALRVALANPLRFAGAGSICGSFPVGDMPLARLKEARRLPLFLAAGRRDPQYTRECFLRDVRLLHSAGMDVTPREYDCGQELSTGMLADCNRFLMSQVVSAV